MSAVVRRGFSGLSDPVERGRSEQQTAHDLTVDVRAPDRVHGARARTRRFRLVTVAIAGTDGICAIAVMLFTKLVLQDHSPTPAFLGATACAPLVWTGAFQSFGLYDVHHLSAWEEFRRAVAAITVAVSSVLVGSFWWHPIGYRSWLAVSWMSALVLELASRRIWRWGLRQLRRDGYLALRTLIVGTNDEAGRMAGTLLAKPGLGFIPVGYIATREAPASPHGIAVVGTLDHVEETIAAHSIDCLFVAATAIRPEEIVSLSHAAGRQHIDMRVSANLPDVLTSRLSIQPLEDLMVLSLRPVSLSGRQVVAKRVFDLSLGTVLLVLTLPLMGVIALAIRLTSEGPALFRQERVTKGGRKFTMCKFRTMVTDQQQLVREARVDLTAPFFKLEDDPRLTKVGRFLRATSLDELPQLWHVVRGDISLVGPRPLWASQVESLDAVIGPRHEVPAGLTGWWQINGRSTVGPDEALRMDLFYIDNWSLSLDLFILLKTVGTVISRRGAV